jgi:hypothetical protein
MFRIASRLLGRPRAAASSRAFRFLDLDVAMAAKKAARVTIDAHPVWCEVGDHFVTPSEMWPNFDDCRGCCSEKDYLEAMAWEAAERLRAAAEKAV